MFLERLITCGLFAEIEMKARKVRNNKKIYFIKLFIQVEFTKSFLI